MRVRILLEVGVSLSQEVRLSSFLKGSDFFTSLFFVVNRRIFAIGFSGNLSLQICAFGWCFKL